MQPLLKLKIQKYTTCFQQLKPALGNEILNHQNKHD